MKSEYKVYTVDLKQRPGSRVRYNRDVKLPQVPRKLHFHQVTWKLFGISAGKVHSSSSDNKFVTVYDLDNNPVLEFVRYG